MFISVYVYATECAKPVHMHFTALSSSLCETLNLFLAPGTPEPTATWLQNGKPLQVSDDVKQSFNGRTAKLFFREVYPEDEGSYVCTAVNSEGEVSTTAKLKVKGACPRAKVCVQF